MAKDISGRLLQRGMFEDLYVSYCWATRCRNCGGRIRDTVVYRDKIDGRYSHVVCDDGKYGRRIFERRMPARQEARRQQANPGAFAKYRRAKERWQKLFERYEALMIESAKRDLAASYLGPSYPEKQADSWRTWVMGQALFRLYDIAQFYWKTCSRNEARKKKTEDSALHGKATA